MSTSGPDSDAFGGDLRFTYVNDRAETLLSHSESAIQSLDGFVDALPHWTAAIYWTTDGVTNFEHRLSEGPVMSTLASLGGAVKSAVIDDNGYQMTSPTAELLKHRQTTRPDTTAERVRHVLTDELIDRQRAALDAAYHAGLFE